MNITPLFEIPGIITRLSGVRCRIELGGSRRKFLLLSPLSTELMNRIRAELARGQNLRVMVVKHPSIEVRVEAQTSSDMDLSVDIKQEDPLDVAEPNVEAVAYAQIQELKIDPADIKEEAMDEDNEENANVAANVGTAPVQRPETSVLTPDDLAAYDSDSSASSMESEFPLFLTVQRGFVVVYCVSVLKKNRRGKLACGICAFFNDGHKMNVAKSITPTYKFMALVEACVLALIQAKAYNVDNLQIKLDSHPLVTLLRDNVPVRYIGSERQRDLRDKIREVGYRGYLTWHFGRQREQEIKYKVARKLALKAIKKDLA